MSDVWQGPGWWLASDGKWYPEDAKPGAVYDGDIAQASEPEEPELAAEPVITEPELAAEPVITEPVVAAVPVVAAEAVVIAEPASTAPVTDFAPLAPETPAPIEIEPIEPEPIEIEPIEPDTIESNVSKSDSGASGWQAIEDDLGQTPDDGWTRSLEESDPVTAPSEPVFSEPDSIPPAESSATDIFAGLEAPSNDHAAISGDGDNIPLAASVVAPVPSVESRLADLRGDAPIERTDAWRSPTATDSALQDKVQDSVPADKGRPEVVDLAVPESPSPTLEPTSGPNWSMIGGAIAALLLVLGIVWLTASLFSNGDDGTDDESSQTETTSTETSEPTDPEPEPDVDGPNLVSVFDLRQGDCIVGDVTGQVLQVEKVDCAEEHDFEIYRESLVDNSITDYDEPAISSYAENVCRASLAEILPADDERGIDFKFLQPSIDSWNEPDNPDRLVTCLLFDDDAPLIGRAADGE